MSGGWTLWLPSRVVDVVDAGRRIGRYAFALRVIIAMAAVVSWLVGGVLGEFETKTTLLLLVVAVIAAMSPDGLAPLALIIVMMMVWILAVDPISIPWSCVPALCVLVVHVAAARAASTVNGAALDRAATVLWLRQLGVVAAATLLVWYVVVRFSESPGQASVLTAVIALLAVAALTIALTWSSTAPRPDDPGDPPETSSSDPWVQSS
jgi:hypothetical protein